MKGRCWPIAALIAAAVAVSAGAAGQSGPSSAAAADAFRKFWDARNPGDAAKAAQAIVRSGVSFDDAVARLKRGRDYSAQVSRGAVHLKRRTVVGEFGYDVLVPESYDPHRAYQARFQLHGGVMRPSGDRRASPLIGADQIYILPSAWREAPWWTSAQLENLDAILDTVKRTYNVDENRVVASGVSDGGTGVYYVAMRDTTPFASFLPLNGSLMVLANDRLEIDGELFPTNLLNKPMFVVNGGQDPLYPARAVQPYVEHLKASGVMLDYHPQPDAGHNTSWWPDVESTFEAFVHAHPRDPHPRQVTWEATDRETPARAHWVIIERVAAGHPLPPAARLQPDLNVFSGDGPNHGRELFPRQRPSGRVDAERDGNVVRLRTRGVTELTLLLSPDVFDLSRPIVVVADGRTVSDKRLEPSVATLVKWAARDNDRTMLFGAELKVTLPPAP